ncbi:phage tail protein [Utexia brackfieldae]|uniref:phage tail protein n=1 Tax=Utexia brackfieldae TaxID=3074108 RepID=UPI00370D5077
MLMIYGMFAFELKSIPFQKMSESVQYRYPTNDRFAERPAVQFVGIGEEKITLSGVLYPELTGGRVSLELYRRQSDLGIAWPLINGSGILLGFYINESIQTDKEEFFFDGAARKIEFTFSLRKVDPPAVIPGADILKLL